MQDDRIIHLIYSIRSTNSLWYWMKYETLYKIDKGKIIKPGKRDFQS